MAELSTEVITQAGISPTFNSAAAGGDSFTHGAKTYIHIKNDDASSHTVTVASQYTATPGIGPVDLAITVPAGEERIAGPFNSNFKDSGGDVQLTYDAVTQLTVAVLQSS